MDPRLWSLIEGEPGDEVAVLAKLVRGAEAPAVLRVIARFEQIVSGRLERRNLLALRQDERVMSVKAPLELSPVDGLHRENHRRQERLQRAFREATGAGVCLGIIDWGFDFTHPNFIDDYRRTRLLALWDQRPDPTGSGLRPYGYGRLFMPGAINRALQSADPFGTLGYDHWGADPLDVGTHGTHVADIAAGVGRVGVGGVAPGSDLIFVHLAKHSRGPRSLGNSVTLFEAVDLVVRVAAGRPCVINLSLGGLCGPHDGSSLIEQGLDAAMRQHPNVVIVQSGGNYRRRQVHASGSVGGGERRKLRWTIDPRDRTRNQLDFWYAGRDRLTLTLISPTGEIVAVAGPGDHGVLVWRGRQVGRYGHRLNDPNNGDNQAAFILEASAHGIWLILIEATQVEIGTYDAWIERDDSVPGCQSTLQGSTKQGTTNSISSGILPIVVGAYDPRRGAQASFSSCGPTRDGRFKPELYAPGCGVVAAQSLLWNGTRHHVTAKTGSSMASPTVAGAVALMIEAAGRVLRPEEIRTALRATARPLPSSSTPDCNGWGVLDVDGAVEFASRRLRYLSDVSPAGASPATEEVAARDPMTGRRIKRAKVRDRLGSRILDLLWREISETDVPRMAQRLSELVRLIDRVPDEEAGVLLERLEPKGDLFADFEYRLSTPSRNLIRESLRRRIKPWKPPDPATRSKVNVPVDDPDTGSFPVPVPVVVDPKPRLKLPTLGLQTVKSWTWKTPVFDKIRAAGYFKVLVWGEGQLSLRFTGTDQDLVGVKHNFESPGYDHDQRKWQERKKQIEVELRLGIADVKVEVNNKNFSISAKHKWLGGGGREYNVEMSTDPDEFFKIEAQLKKLDWNVEIYGHRMTAEVTGTLVFALKLDWWKVVEKFVKDKTRKFFDDLISRLTDALKRYFIGKLFVTLGSGLLAWLLGSTAGSATAPAARKPPGSGSVYDPPKGDIVGERAARQINDGKIGDADLTKAVTRDSAETRRAFAAAAGATLRQLMSQQNAQILAEFVNRPQPAESWLTSPPSIDDLSKDWQIWARTRPTPKPGTATMENVILARDDYRHRLRTAEKAVIVGRVLQMRNLIARPSLDLIIGLSRHQASIAGIAAAVQYVQEFIRAETYETVNPDGQAVKQDGAVIWGLLGSGIGSLDLQPEALIDQAGIYMLRRLGPLRRR